MGGKAESPWLALRRCLAMLRRVQQGVATKQELQNAVYDAEGIEAYGLSFDDALTKKFDADKRRLRDNLGIHIGYDKQQKGYVIKELDKPLLDLPDEDLWTLGFLADTFQSDSPHSAEIHHLIATLSAWLTPDRRKLIDQARGLLSIDLRQRDSDAIDDYVWETVVQAQHEKRQLQFDYRPSRSDEDTELREHIVEPWEAYFDAGRRHYYLRGFCLYNDGPGGAWEPKQYYTYRIGRIVPSSIRILSKKLPPYPRKVPLQSAVYELAPAIARFGVSHRPELHGEPIITPLPNGWTRVEGETHDVFQLARSLLFYGANCRVIGGDALLSETVELIRSLNDVYENNAKAIR